MSTILQEERTPTAEQQAILPIEDNITGTTTIGGYLATRLEQIGLKHHFAVAGDYNLVLLDQLLLNKNMKQVYCCNELNCSFSAEGCSKPERPMKDRTSHRLRRI
jgi:hypothetical protein